MSMRGAFPAAMLAAFFVITAGAPALSHPHPEMLETDLMPYPFWTEPLEGDIYHVPTGLKLSFDGMMDMLSGSRVIYVGETHNSIYDHRIQEEIIRALAERFPGRVAVGMEMFRTPQQESLDRWTAGELGEVEFLKESGWYDIWSMDFAYYRDILTFVRDEGIDLVALNPPLELQRQVGMTKPDQLPPEVRAVLPDTDSSDPFQRAVLRAVYSGHEGGEEMYEAFRRVHILWEETMAERIAGYLGSDRGEGKIVVVLAGGGHVKYGFGVPKKVVRRLPLPYSLVLPAVISLPDEEDSETPVFMDVEMPEVPLRAADFIWAVPYEILPKEKVRVGIKLNFSGGEGAIEKVLEGSAAERAGVLAGDVLLRLDETEIGDMTDVVIHLKSKKVGDSVTLYLRRDGEEITLEATFTEPAG